MEAGSSLKQSILKSDLPTIIQDAGEIGIDSLLNDGLLKDIPILGTITSLCKTYGSVRDFYFTKKLFKFLQSISSMNESERLELITKLESDPSYGTYTGERLLDLLSRLDDEKKPSLIASALKLYAKGELTSLQLQQAHYAIDRFQMCDLGELMAFSSTGSQPRQTDGNATTANFINSGLAYVSSGYGGGGVHPTETAAIFIKVITESKL